MGSSDIVVQLSMSVSGSTTLHENKTFRRGATPLLLFIVPSIPFSARDIRARLAGF